MDPAAALRVVHLVPHLSIGGTELQLLHLIAHTPPGRAAHQVLYYAESADPEARRLFDRHGVPVRRVPRAARLSPAFPVRLSRAIEATEPDIVHCWLPNACLWGRLAARRPPARRLVLSIRGTRLVLAGSLRLARLLGDRRVYYLGNTRSVAEAIRRDLGAEARRIDVVPNGVIPPPTDGLPPRADLLAALGEPPGTRLVLSVGRLAIDKNYPMLLRVAGRFRPEERVRFAIAGAGELEETLRREARRLGVEDRVRFLGLRRDIPALLRAAELFAFTSRTEGAPNALLEAMSAGLPIVSTRFTGFEEMIAPDREARVVDHDDDAGFEAAVRGLLVDRQAAHALGETARRTATARFGVGAMVDATLAFYRRILAAPD